MATTIHEPPKIAGRMPAQVNNGNGGGGILAPANGNLSALEDRAPETAKTGIWVALAAITMSFAALTSALVVRQGAAINWQPITLPPLLYANTIVLLASSMTIEIARRRILAQARGIENQNAAPMRWLLITLALGLLFVGGQYVAWLRLRADGLYLATNANSSFFYLFTGVHAFHVLGGLAGLIYVMNKLNRSVLRRSTFGAAAQYWHFMGILWLYLLFVLLTKL